MSNIFYLLTHEYVCDQQNKQHVKDNQTQLRKLIYCFLEKQESTKICRVGIGSTEKGKKNVLYELEVRLSLA